MKGWHAIVPIKAPGQRKTRLSRHLAAHEITALTERMLDHVLDTLEDHPGIGHVTLLSAVPPTRRGIGWFRDPGTGLNPSLTAFARSHPARILVIHADLAGVRSPDIDALTEVARLHGAAIAPDRHGSGTNALALQDARGFPFQFGPDSLLRHGRMLDPACHVVRDGLALDIDTPADLDLAVRHGMLNDPRELVAGALDRRHS